MHISRAETTWLTRSIYVLLHTIPTHVQITCWGPWNKTRDGMFIPSPFSTPFTSQLFFFPPMHCEASNGFKLQILWMNVRWVEMKLRLFTLLVGVGATMRNCITDIGTTVTVI